jgi:succinyl-diaminopimelate desuccinylase
LDEVRRAATFIHDYLTNNGLEVQYYDAHKYPAILAGFPGMRKAPVMFSGHFDVVLPEPDDSQFFPRLDGDYLWGRGAADMKTVLATYMVWMKDRMKEKEERPPVAFLLVGNEENGEIEPMGTPHVLKQLEIDGYIPDILIAGERTGEGGNELLGEICTKNRGVMRFEIRRRGQRGHTGVAGKSIDLIQQLFDTQQAVVKIMKSHLTLTSADGWRTQTHFSYLEAGIPGLFNVSPDHARMGIEIRPIPEDDLEAFAQELVIYCDSTGCQLDIFVKENGISCDPRNQYLLALIQAVQKVSGSEPRLGRKLPGTSARFAPRGQGVVWGQSGIGPHSREEKHFIPSIMPYYEALTEYGRILSAV